MPTVLAPAVNLIAGMQSSIVPPGYADVGNAIVAAEIYNNSQNVLQVQSVDGTRYLQPLTADLFPCPSLVSAPSVTPVSNLPVPSITSVASASVRGLTTYFVGTVTATLYFIDDPLPPIPTFPLPPFPGGAQTIISQTANTPNSASGFLYGVSPSISGAGFVTSGDGQGGTNNIIQVPEGTTSVTITGFYSCSSTGTMSMRLIGVNSGIASSAVVLGTNTVLFSEQSFTVPIVGCNDTVFAVQFADSTTFINALIFLVGSLGPLVPPGGVFANSGPQPPTFPTLTAEQTGNGTIIAAPTNGAWYVFGIDFFSGAAAANDELVLTGNGGNIARSRIDEASATTTGIDHIELAGLRVTTAVTTTLVSAVGITTIRYAPGP